jgi:predicted RNase H-like nuclease
VAVLWNGETASIHTSATLSVLCRILADHARGSLIQVGEDHGDDPVLSVIGIDMPIGLPDRGARQADRLAQKVLGRRASSIFVTPTRDASSLGTQQRVSARNKELEGPGISIQAFNLLPKVREVDDFLRSTTLDLHFVEVHPEVSFQALKGSPLEHSKRTPAGVQERQELLAQVGLVVDPNPVVRSGAVGIDDVIDAAVVAWSARRVHQGVAVSMPDPPEVFSDGLPAAIWS